MIQATSKELTMLYQYTEKEYPSFKAKGIKGRSHIQFQNEYLVFHTEETAFVFRGNGISVSKVILTR